MAQRGAESIEPATSLSTNNRERLACKGKSPTVLNGTGIHRIARDFPLTPRRGQVYPDNTLCRRGSEWITVIYNISLTAGSNHLDCEKWTKRAFQNETRNLNEKAAMAGSSARATPGN